MLDPRLADLEESGVPVFRASKLTVPVHLELLRLDWVLKRKRMFWYIYGIN